MCNGELKLVFLCSIIFGNSIIFYLLRFLYLFFELESGFSRIGIFIIYISLMSTSIILLKRYKNVLTSDKTNLLTNLRNCILISLVMLIPYASFGVLKMHTFCETLSEFNDIDSIKMMQDLSYSQWSKFGWGSDELAIFLCVIMVFLSPIYEDFMIHGLVYNKIYEKFKWAIVLVCPLIFVGLHYMVISNSFEVVTLFLLSFFCVIFRFYFKTWLAALFFHMFYNLSSILPNIYLNTYYYFKYEY